MITMDSRGIDGQDEEWLGSLVRIIEILGERAVRRKAVEHRVAIREVDRRHHSHGTKQSICITGETEKRAANIVLVNGMRVTIGDVPFILFLRLVVELFKNRRGTVRKSTLIKGGYMRADGEFQAVARLRQVFATALDGHKPEELIESCEHRSLRLSIESSWVEYNKNELLHHRNERVRRLAARLP